MERVNWQYMMQIFHLAKENMAVLSISNLKVSINKVQIVLISPTPTV